MVGLKGAASRGPLQMEARFGEPGARMTEALQRCLALEDGEVVGCVAQLATVADAALAQLLSATYRAVMQLLVVKSQAAQKRLAQHLAKHKVRPPPATYASGSTSGSEAPGVDGTSLLVCVPCSRGN